MTRLIATAAMAAAVFFCFAPSAGAAPCAQAPAGGGEAEAASLLLRSEPSTTSLNFEGSSAVKRMIFVFDLSCKLDSAQGITVGAFASEGQEAFGPAETKLAGNQLTVELPVDPGEFGAGKHTAAVTVSGPTITALTTKVAFQRSARWPVPTLVAVLCALLGLVAAVVAKVFAASTRVTLKPVRYLIAFGAVAFAVGAVYKTAYADVEVWQPTISAILALSIAAVSAAFGAASTALVGAKS